MISETVDLSKYIEMRNDRPHIRGRRIPIMSLIAYQKVNHSTIEELCDDYTLSEAEVLAALLYYRQNQEEMDRQDQEDILAWEELYQRYIHDRQK